MLDCRETSGILLGNSVEGSTSIPRVSGSLNDPYALQILDKTAERKLLQDKTVI